MTSGFRRARDVGPVAVAIGLTALLVWGAGIWLSTRPSFSGAFARPPVAVGGPLLVAVLVSRTLAGDDVDLERTTPRLTTGFRAVQALVVLALPALVLASTLLDHPGTFGAAAVVRNTVGLVGLTLLAAAAGPARLAWVPATILTFATYVAGGHAEGAGAAWWAWLVRPGGWDASWVAAAAFCGTGWACFALRGPRG